ncbi:MAG: hypothetical protein JSS82_15410 [Bacteroidetes bacterium]|nr:hypothetical protein [Bacteroidota bacterium]
MKLLRSVLIIAAMIIAGPFSSNAQSCGTSCDFYHHNGVIYQLAKHKAMVENVMANIINNSGAKNKDAAINAYVDLKMYYDAATTQFVYEMSGKKSLSKTFDRINWAFIKDREKEYCYECKYVYRYDDNNCHYCHYHLHPYQVRWYAQSINEYISDCEKFCAKYGGKKNYIHTQALDFSISDVLSSVDFSHGIYRMHANRREFLASLLLQLKPESVRNLKEHNYWWRTKVVYRNKK